MSIIKDYLDFGVLIVITSAIVSTILYVFTGIFELLYIFVFCVLLDVLHKGIWQPIKEQREMRIKTNNFLSKHRNDKP